MKKFFTAAVFFFLPFGIIACIVADSAFCQGPLRQQQIAPPTSLFGVIFTPKRSQPSVSPQQIQAMPLCSQPAVSYMPNGEAVPVVEQQRIVYVPYACPPPIYIARGKNGQPSHRMPFLPKGLMPQGPDVYLQEYPEMPQQFYTTRGPRDFFAANPPSIGE